MKRWMKGLRVDKKSNISTAFKFLNTDSKIIENILEYEGTPEAILRFDELSEQLSDYAYWFVLSTLWVSYTGHTELQRWKRLFSSSRANKSISLMKPDELSELKKLPNKILAYRVHRRNETDWIAYTLDFNTAVRFAKEREVNEITVYKIKKNNVLSLFLRRGEFEVLVLDKERVKQVRTIAIDESVE